MQSLEASLGCLRIKDIHYPGVLVESDQGYYNGPLCQQGGYGFDESLNVAFGEPPEHEEEMNAYPGYFVESDEPLESEAFGYNVLPFYRQGYGLVPNFHMNIFETQFYPMTMGCPVLVRNRIPYPPPMKVVVPPQGNPHGVRHQEFQYFVVIDFEATCDKEKRPPYPQEIIEFPSVLVNGVTGEVESSFQIYVRPKYHPQLTDFCKELTGIEQSQVDKGVTLSEALLMHDKWLEDKGIMHKNFAVVTWSDWDCRAMVESECKFKNIKKPPYFNRWINLQVPFEEVYGTKGNLKKSIQLAGLTWEGRAHCGLDDARNTARLLSLMMSRGYKFSITSSLDGQVAHPPTDPTQHTQRPKDQVGPNVGEGCHHCYCGV